MPQQGCSELDGHAGNQTHEFDRRLSCPWDLDLAEKWYGWSPMLEVQSSSPVVQVQRTLADVPRAATHVAQSGVSISRIRAPRGAEAAHEPDAEMIGHRGSRCAGRWSALETYLRASLYGRWTAAPPQQPVLGDHPYPRCSRTMTEWMEVHLEVLAGAAVEEDHLTARARIWQRACAS